MDRAITVGEVTGTLRSTHTCRGVTEVELLVGGLRSLWFLLPETEVEVLSP
jgi:hypothetical protein